MRGTRYPSAIGFAVLITLCNHCLVSITSGYLIRENVMLYMVLLVGMAERYLPRAVRKKRTETSAASVLEAGGGLSLGYDETRPARHHDLHGFPRIP